MRNLFGEEYENVSQKIKSQDTKKRAWEDGFQRWRDAVFSDEANHYGACGYGGICDFCENNSYGRPCVRALNEMCRERFLEVDYSDKSEENYRKWFDGCK